MAHARAFLKLHGRVCVVANPCENVHYVVLHLIGTMELKYSMHVGVVYMYM